MWGEEDHLRHYSRTMDHTLTGDPPEPARVKRGEKTKVKNSYWYLTRSLRCGALSLPTDLIGLETGSEGAFVLQVVVKSGFQYTGAPYFGSSSTKGPRESPPRSLVYVSSEASRKDSECPTEPA